MSDASAVLKSLIDAERQSTRLLRLSFSKGDGPASALLVANRLEADEGLSRDFRFGVQVISDSATLSLKDVVGKLVTIELMRDDGSVRYFNGHVFEFGFVRNDSGLAYYDMVLLPWLAFLRLRIDNYLFHGKNVEAQTASIFADYPGANWRSQHLGPDEPMTDAFQINESDYNYVHRRWEAKGWSYHYEHSAAGHTLVLTGDSSASAPIDGGGANAGTITWQGQSGVRDNGLWSLSPVRGVASTLYRGRSFDFKNPLPVLEVEIPTNNEQGAVPPLEVYEYAGEYGFKHRADAEAQARTRIEGMEAAGKHFGGSGDNDCVQAGRSFKLSGHVDAAAFDDGGGSGGSGSSGAGSSSSGDDLEFLILEARHTATNNYQVQDATAAEYSNSLTCLRKKIPWRPGRGFNSTEPKVYALQTAIVVGPQGEEIHTDPYGRVRVQFHWDRVGTYDEKSSAWIRVASTWAGSNFGFMAVPRIGQEVIVQWLDGNPDRPIITGRVYNQLNMPPWELPANQTQTGILSRSSNDGTYDNANALRFEDKKGAEELWLHAEKDQRIEVEHDETHWVGHDRSKTIDHDETVHVKHDRTETVDNDEAITVHHDRTETVDHNETITVHNNRTETVDRNESITIHNDRSERVDHNETISIGDNRSEDVGQNETVSIGGSRSVTIGGNKSETVGATKNEMVAVAKALTVGAGYAVTVGGAMNTAVGLAQFEQVGLSKTSTVGGSRTDTVGTTLSITAGQKIELVCGNSRIVLTPEAIYLDGVDIHVKAGQQVHVDGPKDVNLNAGTAQAAPGGCVVIEVENHSGVPHQLFEKQGAHGEPLDVLVLRGSFDMVQHGEPIVPSAVQSPVSFGDSFAGPSQPHLLRSVVVEEGDLVVFKPGTDVLVSGTASAPNGQAREHWLARLSLGSVHKTLKLHGPRRFRRGVLGWKLSAAEPVNHVALDDRLAYGGCFDAMSAHGVQTAHHSENPAGTGWLPDAASLDALPRDARKLVEQQVSRLDTIAAPQIEHPLQPLQAPGALGQYWNLTPRPRWSASRLALQGRMDEAWLAQRHPLLPEDFDPRFFQAAAPDQVSTPWLQGDETLRLEGLLAQPRCEMRLPGWRMLAVPRLASGFEYVTLPVLDTVRIDLTRQRITLLWRAHFRRDDPLLGLTLGVTDRPIQSHPSEALNSGALM